MALINTILSKKRSNKQNIPNIPNDNLVNNVINKQNATINIDIKVNIKNMRSNKEISPSFNKQNLLQILYIDLDKNIVIYIDNILAILTNEYDRQNILGI